MHVQNSSTVTLLALHISLNNPITEFACSNRQNVPKLVTTRTGQCKGLAI